MRKPWLPSASRCPYWHACPCPHPSPCARPCPPQRRQTLAPAPTPTRPPPRATSNRCALPSSASSTRNANATARPRCETTCSCSSQPRATATTWRQRTTSNTSARAGTRRSSACAPPVMSPRTRAAKWARTSRGAPSACPHHGRRWKRGWPRRGTARTFWTPISETRGWASPRTYRPRWGTASRAGSTRRTSGWR